jgi:hypothetical protein
MTECNQNEFAFAPHLSRQVSTTTLRGELKNQRLWIRLQGAASSLCIVRVLRTAAIPCVILAAIGGIIHSLLRRILWRSHALASV